jgi:hypothetical protein
MHDVAIILARDGLEYSHHAVAHRVAQFQIFFLRNAVVTVAHFGQHNHVRLVRQNRVDLPLPKRDHVVRQRVIVRELFLAGIARRRLSQRTDRHFSCHDAFLEN